MTPKEESQTSGETNETKELANVSNGNKNIGVFITNLFKWIISRWYIYPIVAYQSYIWYASGRIPIMIPFHILDMIWMTFIILLVIKLKEYLLKKWKKEK